MARTPRYTYRLIHLAKGWRYLVYDHDVQDFLDQDFATEQEAHAYLA